MGLKKTLIELRVQQTSNVQDDINGIVRISPHLIKEHEFPDYTLVEISSRTVKKPIGAVVLPTTASTKANIIQMGSLKRELLGVKLEDNVTIQTIDLREAEEITLAPITEGTRFSTKKRVKKILLSLLTFRVVVQGEEVLIPTQVKSKRSEGIDEILDHYLQSVVVATKPPGIVVITPKTKLHILPFMHQDFLRPSRLFSYVPYTPLPQEEQITKYCKVCNTTPKDPHDRFCRNCGAKLLQRKLFPE